MVIWRVLSRWSARVETTGKGAGGWWGCVCVGVGGGGGWVGGGGEVAGCWCR